LEGIERLVATKVRYQLETIRHAKQLRDGVD
jgi:hypothetical protein